MSYTLDLYFEPTLKLARLIQYFEARQHYTLEEDDVLYGNPSTEVYFSFHIKETKRRLFGGPVVIHVEFEINYSRPSFFGIEAEIELSVFMAEFRPRIFDPQMEGMDEGPYSGEGFLNGWSFGNRLSASQALVRNPERLSLPAAKLHAFWDWNYHRDELSHRLRTRRFVPNIQYFQIDGHICTTAIWPFESPISLPQTDYVVPFRSVLGQKRYGLVPWSEVLDLARESGFKTGQEPLEIEYSRTPPAIVKWFTEFELIDHNALQLVHAYRIIDEELRGRPPTTNSGIYPANADAGACRDCARCRSPRPCRLRSPARWIALRHPPPS
jgi:hypothetical protein